MHSLLNPLQVDRRMTLTCRGGLHILFNSQPKHKVSLPKRLNQDEDKAGDERPVNVKYLIRWMKDNLLSERVEMFGDGDGV